MVVHYYCCDIGSISRRIFQSHLVEDNPSVDSSSSFRGTVAGYLRCEVCPRRGIKCVAAGGTVDDGKMDWGWRRDLGKEEKEAGGKWFADASINDDGGDEERVGDKRLLRMDNRLMSVSITSCGEQCL